MRSGELGKIKSIVAEYAVPHLLALLVFVGGFNGLILPIGFTAILWVAWRRRDLLQGYVYPKWLLGIGVAAWLLTLFLGWESLSGLQQLWG